MYKLYSTCVNIISTLSEFAHTLTQMLMSPLSEILTDSILGTIISFVLPESVLRASLIEFAFGGLITYIIAKLCYNFIKP